MESPTSKGAPTETPEGSFNPPKPPVSPFELPTASNSNSSEGPSTYRQWVIRASDACVLPGRGRPKDLPRLSHFQREVQRKVAQEWGLDYPYVPDHVMEVVENSWEQWENMIWDYLHVPKPQWTPDSEVWVRFKQIQSGSSGGHILRQSIGA